MIPWATLLIILPLLTAMAVCVWSRIAQPLVLMFSLSMVIAVIGLTAGAITKYWLKDGAIAAQMDWVIWVLWISTVLNAIYFLPILWRLWLLPAPIQWPSKVTAANPWPVTPWQLLLPPALTGFVVIAFGILAMYDVGPIV